MRGRIGLTIIGVVLASLPLFVFSPSTAVEAQSNFGSTSRASSTIIGTAVAVPASASVSAPAQNGTGTTPTLTPTNGLIPAQHSIQLVVTGGPTGCTYRLQGSNDGGTNWFNISASDITCTSSTASFEANKPTKLIRGNLLTLSGGTTPTVTLHYAGV